MKRLLVLVVALPVFVGCRGQVPPASDPFLFGRTRVPPPATGTISGQSPNPYYRGSPNRVSPQSSAPPARSGVASRPVAVVGSPTFSSAGTSAPAAKLAEREPVIQVLQPRPEVGVSSGRRGAARSAASSAQREPRRLESSTQAVDIMDLPEPTASGTAPRAESISGAAGFRVVSDAQQQGDSPGAMAASFTSPSRYGHDPDYEWVRGRLDYSQIDRRWKLRYIPVDGTTDDFGGSVVLPDAKVLAGYERGDFVEIRGRVAERDPNRGFAPTYEVAQIKPLGSTTP